MFLRKSERGNWKRGENRTIERGTGEDRIEDQEVMRLGTGDGEAVSLRGGNSPGSAGMALNLASLTYRPSSSTRAMACDLEDCGFGGWEGVPGI